MSNNQAPKPTKPIKERIEESMNILYKLQELGISDTDPGYKALSAKFNEWIRGGEAWFGNVDFHRWDRRAKVLLPTKPGTQAKCDFLVHKF
jgi:hypothetical protein